MGCATVKQERKWNSKNCFIDIPFNEHLMNDKTIYQTIAKLFNQEIKDKKQVEINIQREKRVLTNFMQFIQPETKTSTERHGDYDREIERIIYSEEIYMIIYMDEDENQQVHDKNHSISTSGSQNLSSSQLTMQIRMPPQDSNSNMITQRITY